MQGMWVPPKHTLQSTQRKQWVGFDGAPVSQSLSYGTPVNQKDCMASQQ